MEYHIKAKIEETFAVLDKRRVETKRAVLSAEEDDPAILKLKTRAFNAARALNNFHTIVHNVPPQFELRFRPVVEIAPEKRKEMRQVFNDVVKEGFYRGVFRQEQKNLERMKISPKVIKSIAQTKGGEFYKVLRDLGLDMTVDHDVDIDFGGSNESNKNLRLVAYHINQFRNIFLMTQKVEDGFPEHGVLALGFRGKARVPVFKGGFRKRDQSPEALRARIKEDCGIELEWL